MSNLRNFTVNVEDGRATVDLDSIVVDHRPGTTFVWRLQVIDTDKNPSIDVCYDQQIFQVEADGAIEPNFHEVVELPSGAARISVMLYTIHPKFTLETLKQLDPEVRNTHRLFRGTEPN